MALIDEVKRVLGEGNIAYILNDDDLPEKVEFDFAQDVVYVGGELADDTEGIRDFLEGKTTFYMDKGLYLTPEEALARSNHILPIAGKD